MNYNLIWGMATLMVCVHQFTFYHTLLDKLKINFKPFNCILCSTFWSTLIVSGISDWTTCIFISTGAAVLAEWIDIQIHKL